MRSDRRLLHTLKRMMISPLKMLKHFHRLRADDFGLRLYLILDISFNRQYFFHVQIPKD